MVYHKIKFKFNYFRCDIELKIQGNSGMALMFYDSTINIKRK